MTPTYFFNMENQLNERSINLEIQEGSLSQQEKNLKNQIVTEVITSYPDEPAELRTAYDNAALALAMTNNMISCFFERSNNNRYQLMNDFINKPYKELDDYFVTFSEPDMSAINETIAQYVKSGCTSITLGEILLKIYLVMCIRTNVTLCYSPTYIGGLKVFLSIFCKSTEQYFLITTPIAVLINFFSQWLFLPLIVFILFHENYFKTALIFSAWFVISRIAWIASLKKRYKLRKERNNLLALISKLINLVNIVRAPIFDYGQIITRIKDLSINFPDTYIPELLPLVKRLSELNSNK